MKQERNIAKLLVENWLIKEAKSIEKDRALYEDMTKALSERCPVWMKLDALSNWVNYTDSNVVDVEAPVYGIMKEFYREVSPYKKVEGTMDQFERGCFVVRPNIFDREIEVKYTRFVYMVPKPFDSSEDIKLKRREVIKDLEHGCGFAFAALKLTEFEEEKSIVKKGLLLKQIAFYHNMKALKSEKTRNSWIKDYEKLMRDKELHHLSKNRVIDRFQRDVDYIYESGLHQFLTEMKENTDFKIVFKNIPEIIGDSFGMSSLKVSITA